MASIEQEVPAAAGGSADTFGVSVPHKHLIRHEVFFCGRKPEDFTKLEEMFRRVPAAVPFPPVLFQEWWEGTALCRQEWQKELELKDARYRAPFNSHFMLVNLDPDELKDGAGTISPVFMALASYDEECGIRFSENIISGAVVYGELINPVRRNFSDLFSSERELVA